MRRRQRGHAYKKFARRGGGGAEVPHRWGVLARLGRHGDGYPVTAGNAVTLYTEGAKAFDAMAAAAPQQLAALQAEMVEVLAWATARFGEPAPLEDGGEWDYALEGVQELVTPLAATFDAAAGGLALRPQGDGVTRTTLTLTLTGGEPFCDALRAEFGIG